MSRILLVGSKSPILQQEALGIFSLMVQYSVFIEPEWIPIADYISHIQDFDDWQLNSNVFYWLNNGWGPCTVDRLASFCNTQLPRFNSHYCNPGSKEVDCFTCDWTGEINWWCPPVYLILRLLRHTLNCKCRGILFCLIGLQLHFGLSFVLMAVILLYLSSISVTCLCLRPCFCLVGVPQASFVQCLLLESWVCYWILIGLLMTLCCSLNPCGGFSILFCHQLSVRYIQLS